jgi:hypothetical protein
MKYLEIDQKQMRFLEWLIKSNREFIATGDEVNVKQGLYPLHESKKQFSLKKDTLYTISDMFESGFIIEIEGGRKVKVSPSDVSMYKRADENIRLEDQIRRELEFSY